MLRWWIIKVLSSMVLITILVLNYLTDWYFKTYPIDTRFSISIVLIGGVIFFYHYYQIKRKNVTLDAASELVTGPGLFRYVRHPMYFGELLIILGYMLLAFNLVTLLVFLIGSIAILKQSKVEDQFLAKKYQSRHQDWAQSTKLIIPVVY